MPVLGERVERYVVNRVKELEIEVNVKGRAIDALEQKLSLATKVIKGMHFRLSSDGTYFDCSAYPNVDSDIGRALVQLDVLSDEDRTRLATQSDTSHQ